MDILVLSREFPPYVMGGISYHLCNLYNQIAEQGHKVTVLAGKCPQSWNSLTDRIHPSIEVKPVQFGFRKGYYLLYPLALKNYLRNFDTRPYDIVSCHTPIPFRVNDLPIVTKYHDCTVETHQYMGENLSTIEKIGDRILHPIRKRIDRKSLLSTDFAIFNSGVNKTGWLSNYNIDLQHRIIHNGVDTNLFYPEQSANQEYVVFVGSTSQKGLNSVLDYADKFTRPVHIVGNVDVEHDNVTSHGRVSQDELRRIYSAAAVTIHPAKFESFGNVVLESLACGTPVVTTKECGASEILSDSTGVVSNNLDQAIETAVEYNAVDCVSTASMFTWDKVAQETIELFQDVAG
ncbi:glycosyltransferase family 4 protein [Haloferax volcanii]|uniref:Glycosyltransferase n=1 Tax=Haloferax volcanii TaxID=2246 RepID=A0A847TT20_HALVO|nr:glycosyltransferase family 4 protein [Haloferax alexandrinus]NLV03627.1 glycosyltransferase [Haloferax alexandrinus]